MIPITGLEMVLMTTAIATANVVLLAMVVNTRRHLRHVEREGQRVTDDIAGDVVRLRDRHETIRDMVQRIDEHHRKRSREMTSYALRVTAESLQGAASSLRNSASAIDTTTTPDAVARDPRKGK